MTNYNDYVLKLVQQREVDEEKRTREEVKRLISQIESLTRQAHQALIRADFPTDEKHGFTGVKSGNWLPMAWSINPHANCRNLYLNPNGQLIYWVPAVDAYDHEIHESVTTWLEKSPDVSFGTRVVRELEEFIKLLSS